MPEPSPFLPEGWEKRAAVRAVEVATRQWGVIGRRQLLDCGLSSSKIDRWIQRHHLHPIHAGVYAVGHRRISTAGRCVAALLHAGEPTGLSHLTAAWWWGLIEREPEVIDVSSGRRARSTTGVRVHHPRKLQTARHRTLQVTPVARTLRDIAFLLPASGTRQALSEADYMRLLDLAKAERQFGRGRPGAAALRRELERFHPDRGLTRSALEDEFLTLCERYELLLPRLNVKIGRFTVDTVWLEQHLVVELDGGRAHGTAAAVAADRARDLYLRNAGFRVLRYSWAQVFHEDASVAADLRRHLAAN